MSFHESIQTKKIALVTGVGSGIGKAVAVGLVNDGIIVIGVGRKLNAINDLHNSLSDKNYFHPFVCDISVEDDVEKLFEYIQSEFNQLDYLINCAGIFPRNLLQETSLTDWKECMLTNLYGAAILYKKVMPIMLNQKFGRVLSLGSKLAENPKALTSAYSASKAGLTALTFSVVQELYQKTESYPNIYFDILYPGPTATNLLNPKGGESEIRKQLANGGQAPSVVYKYVKLLLRSKFRLTGNIYLKNKVIKRVDIKCQIKQLISYFKRK